MCGLFVCKCKKHRSETAKGKGTSCTWLDASAFLLRPSRISGQASAAASTACRVVDQGFVELPAHCARPVTAAVLRINGSVAGTRGRRKKMTP